MEPISLRIGITILFILLFLFAIISGVKIRLPYPIMKFLIIILISIFVFAIKIKLTTQNFYWTLVIPFIGKFENNYLIKKLLIGGGIIKNHLLGENVRIIGIACEIEEINKIIYHIIDNGNHILGSGYTTNDSYCLVNVMEISLVESFSKVKINNSLKVLNDDYNLFSLYKIDLVCRKWWFKKEYLYCKKINYIKN